MDLKATLGKIPNWFKGAIYGLVVLTLLNFLMETYYGIYIVDSTALIVTGLFFGTFLGLTYDIVGALMSKQLNEKTVQTEYARTTLAFLAFALLFMNSYVANVIPLDLGLPYATTGETYRIGVTVYVYDSAGKAIPFTVGIRDSSNNQLLRQDVMTSDSKIFQVNTDLGVHRIYVNCIGQNYQVGKNVQFTPIPGFGIVASFGGKVGIVGPALDCAASQCQSGDLACKHYIRSCSGTNLVWKDPQGFVTEIIESCASQGSCYDGDTRTSAHCQTPTSSCPANTHLDSTGKCIQDTTATTLNPYPRNPTTTLYNPPIVDEPTTTLRRTTTTEPQIPRQCSVGAVENKFESCYNSQLSYSKRVCNNAGQWGSWETTSLDCKTQGQDICSPQLWSNSNPTRACMKSTTQTTQPQQTTTTTLPKEQGITDSLVAIVAGFGIVSLLIAGAVVVVAFAYRKRLAPAVRKLIGQ